MTPRPRRREGRPSPPPPALLFAPGQLLPGTEILDELREPLAVPLWQAAHDVHLWAGTPPADRARLFETGALERRLALLGRAVPDPEAGSLLVRLAALLLRDPAAAPPREVAAACLGVVAWAERRSDPGTALVFAQAAALAAPDDAQPALQAGLLALRRGEDARAESWLRRALALARRVRGNPAYVRANLGLGVVYARRKQPLAARRFYLFALRRARRCGLGEEKGAALHGLFDLAVAGGTPDDPDALARSTLHVYGAGHARAPELWAAWVRWRLARDPAAVVVGVPDESLPFHGPPVARARLLALLAREAAAVGAREQFDRAWSRAWELFGRHVQRDGGRGRAGVLLELARAAAAAERWDLAEYAGQRALEAALARGEEGERGEAERFLASLWQRNGGMRWIGTPHGPEQATREEDDAGLGAVSIAER